MYLTNVNDGKLILDLTGEIGTFGGCGKFSAEMSSAITNITYSHNQNGNKSISIADVIDLMYLCYSVMINSSQKWNLHHFLFYHV